LTQEFFYFLLIFLLILSFNFKLMGNQTFIIYFDLFSIELSWFNDLGKKILVCWYFL